MILCVCPNPSVDIYVWIQSINAGKVNRSLKEKYFPGGKGVHVALACAELGEEVTLLGFWGGPTGEWIRNECAKYNIRTIGIEVKEWSRTCQTFKTNNEFNESEILGVGPTIDKKQQLKFENIFKQHLPSVSCITMSGSWPKGAHEDSYARLIEIGKKYGKDTFLDCTGKPLESALKQKPYIVHLNVQEAETLFGKDKPEKLTQNLSKSCDIAAVTAGQRGLFLSNGRQVIHGFVEVGKVYSSVGSGDCLVAGLVISYVNEYKMEEIVRMGVACGGANCLREDLGMLYKSDVEFLYEKVYIK